MTKSNEIIRWNLTKSKDIYACPESGAHFSDVGMVSYRFEVYVFNK